MQALQSRKMLSEMSERIERNSRLMQMFLEKYQDPLPYAVEADLGMAYQGQSFNLFSLQEKQNSKKWCDQPYERNAAYPEKLTQKTMRGDFVRSKSEVIIANAYFAKDIQYRCEEIVRVGEKNFAPDFTVLVPRLNKTKYHEHFGMMHDKQYRDRALYKIGAYIAAGYRPYEDVIFTFDDIDGNIDTQVLDNLINTFCR